MLMCFEKGSQGWFALIHKLLHHLQRLDKLN